MAKELYEATIRPCRIADHYSRGEIGERETFPTIRLEGERLLEVLGQILIEIGVDTLSQFRDGCWSPREVGCDDYFVYTRVCNSAGKTPTDEEHELFAKEEITLFNYYYEISIKQTRMLTSAEIEREIGTFGNN